VCLSGSGRWRDDSRQLVRISARIPQRRRRWRLLAPPSASTGTRRLWVVVVGLLRETLLFLSWP